MKRYVTTGQTSPKLKLEDAPDVHAKRGEVVIDIKAVSLNYRDLLQAHRGGIVPASDDAGIVSAVGEDVRNFAVGERVVIGFMTGWTEGEFSIAKQGTSLGGELDGVLTQRIVVPADAIVHIRDDISFEEAACLPCAGGPEVLENLGWRFRRISSTV